MAKTQKREKIQPAAAQAPATPSGESGKAAGDNIGPEAGKPTNAKSADGNGDRGGGGTDTPPVTAPAGASLQDAELGTRFPLLSPAITAWRQSHQGQSPRALRITSKREGFRRAGISHTVAPVDHPSENFTAEQVETLLGEPQLTVEFV